jgi:hypothetical protein
MAVVSLIFFFRVLVFFKRPRARQKVADRRNTILNCLLFDGRALERKVSGEKELTEEEQVASVHEKCSNVVSPIQGTFGIHNEVVIAHNGRGNSHDHLTNLHRSDYHRIEPLGFHPKGHEKVIAVHGSMDRIVHGCENNTRRGCRNIRMPAV